MRTALSGSLAVLTWGGSHGHPRARMLTPESMRIHEAGHALMLVSTGHPHLLIEIQSGADENSGARNVIAGYAEIEDGWPSWVQPGFDRATEIALSIMAFGGMAAEIAVLERRPKEGWLLDMYGAAVRVALLAHAPRHETLDIAKQLDVEKGDRAIELLGRLREVTVAHSPQLDLMEVMRELEQEALRRTKASVPALKRIAEAVRENPILPAADICRILDASPWCGVLGSSQIRSL